EISPPQTLSPERETSILESLLFLPHLLVAIHLIFLILRVGLGEFAIIWDIVAAKNLGVKS
ncbi:MAG: hypothetical protein ACK552_23070, partial [Microcystis sp.]